MTISIWIIIIIIFSAGAWFYYKKNIDKVKEPEIKIKEKKDKKSFAEIDKMLSHVTKSNLSDDSKETETEDIEANSNNVEINEKDIEFDIKEKVIGSIILERKKKN